MRGHSITSLRRRLARRIATTLEPALTLHDLQIMQWRAGDLDPGGASGRLHGFLEYSDDAMRLLGAVQRNLTAERARQRFDRGLQLFALEGDGGVLATTWIVRDAERFIDELGLGFKASGNNIWLRDIFVNPSCRGRGHFARLLRAIVHASAQPIESLSSAIATDNAASLHAHRKFGFRKIAHYTVLELFHCGILRLRWPLHTTASSAFAPQRRFVCKGRDYRDYLARRIA